MIDNRSVVEAMRATARSPEVVWPALAWLAATAALVAAVLALMWCSP